MAGKHDVVNEASWESLAKEIEALRKANAALRFNQSVLDLTRMFVWGWGLSQVRFVLHLEAGEEGDVVVRMGLQVTGL